MGNTVDSNFKAERDARLRAELEAIMDPDARVLFEKKLQLVADIEAVPIPDPDPVVLSVAKPEATKTTQQLDEHFRAALSRT
jgi:hypothetical protein